MKAFVIMCNRLTWPKALCENLADQGLEVILIDNGSCYAPLMKWYNKCPYKVHYLPDTYGHQSLWQSNIISQYKDQHYIVTDHDLDISGVPKDWIEVLFKGLNDNPDLLKSGLSLKLSDLPENKYTKEVIEWETKFWKDKRGEYYFSDIDTTLAMYDRDRFNQRWFSAVRSPKPYEARHLPWYNTPADLTDEEIFYMNNIKRTAYWTLKFKEAWSL